MKDCSFLTLKYHSGQVDSLLKFGELLEMYMHEAFDENVYKTKIIVIQKGSRFTKK
jgi:hypothetical protein